MSFRWLWMWNGYFFLPKYLVCVETGYKGFKNIHVETHTTRWTLRQIGYSRTVRSHWDPRQDRWTLETDHVIFFQLWCLVWKQVSAWFYVFCYCIGWWAQEQEVSVSVNYILGKKYIQDTILLLIITASLSIFAYWRQITENPVTLGENSECLTECINQDERINYSAVSLQTC